MEEETEQIEQTPRSLEPNFLTSTRFDGFDLPPEILSGLTEAGFINCTPIQAQVLPVSLTGRDVAGQAQTGTGKTAAFLVTLFNKLLRNPEKKAGMPRALIIAPTRELALQVLEDAKLLGAHTGLTLAVAIGGIDYREQAEAIKKGPDIVIATPGRIIDYLKQGIFKTSQIEVLIIDEADRLFDLGFIKDLRFLLRKLPPYDKRQSMLFSATLSYRVLELTYEYMNLPEFIAVTPEDITVDRIEQSLFHVGRNEKLALLLGLLEREDWTRVLIFVNTKAGVEWVAQRLQDAGLPAEGITGDLPQRKRLQLMQRFKDDRLKILVATDVASRGIHVEDISHVINYDLPQDVENYVHRIGRTARAGRTGKAFAFACEDYVYHLEPLEQLLGFNLPVVWPEDDWFKTEEAEKLTAKAASRPRSRSGRDKPSSRRERGSDRSASGSDRRGRGSQRSDADSDRRSRRSDRSATEKIASDSDRKTEQSRPEAPPRTKKRPKVSRPGGIFGLAPGYKEELVQEQVEETEVKKKRRRRRKRKPSGDGESTPPSIDGRE